MSLGNRINGDERLIDVDKDAPLRWVVRDVLRDGTKSGCGMALRGARTMHVDGHVVRRALGGFFGELMTVGLA
ncbi:MAG: hypothetical protein WDO56_05260 [Gammaproteobacteria bacterium]